MYFIGVTRFSIFRPGSQEFTFSRTRTDDRYIAELYSDQRLKERFDIFFNRAATIYQQMSQSHFYRHILQYSSNLPEKWKEELLTRAREFPVIYLQDVDQGPSIAKVIKSLLNGQKSGPLAFFRVDDDDILSTDYIQQLSLYTRPEFVGMAVTFGFGIAAEYENGVFRNFRECHFRFLTAGLARIIHYDADAESINLPKGSNHTLYDRHFPSIVDSRSVTYLWTHHPFQSSKSSLSSLERRQESVRSMLAQMPVLEDLNGLADKFPGFETDFAEHSKGDSLVVQGVTSSQSLPRNGFQLKLTLSKGGYFMEYSIGAESSPGDPKGAIACFQLTGKIPERVDGLTLSRDSRYGWYQYLNVSGLDADNRSEFFLPEGCSVTGIVIRPWNCKTGLMIKKLNVIKSRGT